MPADGFTADEGFMSDQPLGSAPATPIAPTEPMFQTGRAQVPEVPS